MAEKRNRSTVAAALGMGKARTKHVPTLNEMLEAHCMGPFPGVKNFGKHEHDAEFVCTACGRTVAIVEVRAHPVLHVGICKHCYDFQVSDPFTKDHPRDPFWHENECRWCGDGGFEVILCDSCPKVFCKYCIRRNFGEEILSAIESPPREWSCFVCNNEHLQILNRDHLQATLIGGVLQTLVRNYNDVKNLVKTMKRSSKPQKSKMSRFEGDSASTDGENSNNQSSLPGSPLHHQDDHPSFLKQLTATNIGHPDYGVGNNSGQFVFPRGFIKTLGEKNPGFCQIPRNTRRFSNTCYNLSEEFHR